MKEANDVVAGDDGDGDCDGDDGLRLFFVMSVGH